MIRIQNIELSRNERQILGPLSLEIDARRVGIVGQNGSGKSSFLRLLAGLIEPDSGEILTNGINLFEDRKAALNTVGMMFQNPEHQIIFPTVIEELVFGLKQQGIDKKEAYTKAQGILELFGHEDWTDRQVHNLSGGQKHLICLMAVLLMKPKIILCDEPFAGLDIPTRMQLHRHLMSVDQSIVLITHDPELLLEYDQIIWLDAGKVVEVGSPKNVIPRFMKTMKELGQKDA